MVAGLVNMNPKFKINFNRRSYYRCNSFIKSEPLNVLNYLFEQSSNLKLYKRKYYEWRQNKRNFIYRKSSNIIKNILKLNTKKKQTENKNEEIDKNILKLNTEQRRTENDSDEINTNILKLNKKQKQTENNYNEIYNNILKSNKKQKQAENGNNKIDKNILKLNKKQKKRANDNNGINDKNKKRKLENNFNFVEKVYESSCKSESPSSKFVILQKENVNLNNAIVLCQVLIFVKDSEIENVALYSTNSYTNLIHKMPHGHSLGLSEGYFNSNDDILVDGDYDRLQCIKFTDTTTPESNLKTFWTIELNKFYFFDKIVITIPLFHKPGLSYDIEVRFTNKQPPEDLKLAHRLSHATKNKQLLSYYSSLNIKTFLNDSFYNKNFREKTRKLSLLKNRVNYISQNLNNYRNKNILQNVHRLFQHNRRPDYRQQNFISDSDEVCNEKLNFVADSVTGRITISCQPIKERAFKYVTINKPTLEEYDRNNLLEICEIEIYPRENCSCGLNQICRSNPQCPKSCHNRRGNKPKPLGPSSQSKENNIGAENIICPVMKQFCICDNDFITYKNKCYSESDCHCNSSGILREIGDRWLEKNAIFECVGPEDIKLIEHLIKKRSYEDMMEGNVIDINQKNANINLGLIGTIEDVQKITLTHVIMLMIVVDLGVFLVSCVVFKIILNKQEWVD